MKKDLVNIENVKIKDIDINENIFCQKVFPDIIHQYIRYQNAKSRQGTHKTKSRSEVSWKSKKPFSQKAIEDKKTAVMKKLNLSRNLTDYFVFSGKISNKAYSYEKAKINILLKDGSIKELKDASDQTLNKMLSKRVNKFSLCYLNIK